MSIEHSHIREYMKLYRFEKNIEERWNTILSNKIWISAPSEFNDLDDCKITKIKNPRLTPEKHDLILKGMDLFYPQGSISENVMLSPGTLEDFKFLISPHGLNGQSLRSTVCESYGYVSIREEIRNTTGIHCFFSEIPNSALMWAHYADNHKGFCIEYDVDMEKAVGLFEVEYSSKPPTPSPTEFIFSPEETFSRIVTTKRIEWHYEKEWRLVYLKALNNNEKGKKIKMPDYLKPVGIILGDRFDFNNRGRIKMIEDMGIECITYEYFKDKIKNRVF